MKMFGAATEQNGSDNESINLDCFHVAIIMIKLVFSTYINSFLYDG